LSIKNVGKSPEILNCPVSDRNSARRVYRQSSSASRFTAGAFGFLTFTQCTELQNTNVRFGSKADIGLPPGSAEQKRTHAPQQTSRLAVATRLAMGI
jgi:hypothetical protein